MNINELLNSVLISDSNSLGIFDIVIAVLLPAVLSWPLTAIYRYTQKNSNYSVSFVHALFLFSSLTSVITLIIGSNIARAFGLIGALSIIRFRNALKSSLDAVYIFWALSIGMAVGTGYYLAAIVVLILCSIIMLLLKISNYGEEYFCESILKVYVDKKDSSQDPSKFIDKVLEQHSAGFRLLNIIINSQANNITYIYLVTASKSDLDFRYLAELKEIPSVTDVHQISNESPIFAGSLKAK